MTRLGEAKKGWHTVRFDDVVRPVKVDVDPATSGLERYVAGEHMDSDDLHIRRWGTVGDGYLGPAFHRKFVKGQILYGSRRTYLRKVAVAEFDGICANTTFVLEPNGDELIPQLLPFVMQTESFTTHSVKQSRGSVNPYINWRDIAWYEFALPPKDEQRRMAEVLWAVVDVIEKEKRVVDSVVKTLDAIRAEKLLKKRKPRKKLADYCAKDGIQIGPFGSQLHAADYVKDGIPVIMPTDMSDDFIIEDSIGKISEKKANTLSIHRVQLGDILLPRRGELDRRAFIRSGQVGWLCGTGSLRVRIDPKYPARAIFHALAAPQTVQWLRDNAVGTTMPNLNSTIVANIPITLPDDTELHRIMDILDKTEHACEQAKLQIEKMKKVNRMLGQHIFG